MTGSVREMESSLSDRPKGEAGGRDGLRCSWLAVLLLTLSGLSASVSAGQSVSAPERETLVRLGVDRGGQAEDIEALLRQADEAAAQGLPFEPLTNKIREGLAKGADAKRIDVVIRQLATNLETADQLVRELDPGTPALGHEEEVTMLAESFGAGVTPDEVREIRRQAQTSGTSLSLPELASAAKGLAFVKDARLPALEGTEVMVEALRQGFRAHEILDLGRDIKRREADYQAGRADLGALRDAIARGDRPERLIRNERNDRVERVERPSTARPEPSDRPERAPRPEVPTRPDTVDRPRGR